ncbi:hypothetical protein [Tateyamaria sp.]|uniref:hypothetical protein n=1 Tax=Tateyamaria sp. TaxID=1929288 RepID=UPI0032A093EA
MTDEMIDMLWDRVNSADRNKVVAYADALAVKASLAEMNNEDRYRVLGYIDGLKTSD